MKPARLLALSLLLYLPISAQAETLTARQAELLNMVRQDCGSCHGLRMQGGLGLPLTPRDLKDKDRDSLTATILQGRYGTTMPPWNPFVTEAEASWIVDMLIKGLPDAR